MTYVVMYIDDGIREFEYFIDVQMAVDCCAEVPFPAVVKDKWGRLVWRNRKFTQLANLVAELESRVK